MNTTTTEKLIVTRTFAAPRERVFAAWTEPEQIKQWFGPEGCHLLEIQTDLRAGGEYHFLVRSTNNEEWKVRGEYREVTPPTKLSYTWQWEDDPAFARPSLVTVEFIKKGEASTEVRLTHENLPSEESRGNHQHGWNGSLDKLAKLLVK